MADHKIEIDVFLENSERVIQQLQQISSQIERLNSKSLNIRPNVDMTGLNRFISGLQSAATLTRSLSSGFQGLSNFAGSIGDSFRGMSNLFGTDISKFIAQNLVNSAMSMVRSGISDAISRYDILTTFTPYMQIAGVDKATSDAALQRVNQSILGLPIGLDEAAYRLRRYQMFLGDTEQATNFTIGLQNALTAGGASESMKNMAYQQMERLLATGDLATFRQWQSLMTGFGVSSRFIADAMSSVAGKTITPKELTEGLNDGTIAVEDFMKAVEMLGQDWSKVPVDQIPKFVTDMNTALDVYKGTIEAWMSNIHFAVARGSADVLGALNETMQSQQGVGITGVMEATRDSINDIFKAGGEFVRNHPEMISMVFDSIGGFVERAKGFNWELFGTNVMTNLGRVADMIFTAVDAFPPGYFERFLSFATTVAGPLGTIFKMVQGGLPFMLGVFQRFEKFDFNMLLGDITHQVEVFANVIERVLNIVGDERMSKILSFALVWGTPLAKIFGSVSRGLMGLSSAVQVFGGSKGVISGIMSSVAEVNSLLPGVLPVLGAAGIGTAGLMGVGIVETNYKRVLAENAEAMNRAYVGDVTGRLSDTSSMLEGFKTERSEWDTALREVDARSEYATSLITKIKEINDTIMSSSVSPNEREKLKEAQQGYLSIWNEMFPEMAMGMGEGLPLLTKGSAAFVDTMSQDYLSLIDAREHIDAISTARTGAIAQVVEAEAEKEFLNKSLKEQREYASRLQNDIENAQYKVLIVEEGQRDAEQTHVEQLQEAYRQANEDIAETEDRLKDVNFALEEGNALIEKYNLQWDDYNKIITDLSSKEYVIEGQTKAWEDLNESQQAALESYNAYREQVGQTLQETLGGKEAISEVPNYGNSLGQETANRESNLRIANYATGRLEALNDELYNLMNGTAEEQELFERIQGPVQQMYEAFAADPEAREDLYQLEDWLNRGDYESVNRYADSIENIATALESLQNAASIGYGLVSGGGDFFSIAQENPEFVPGFNEWYDKVQSLQELDLSSMEENAEPVNAVATATQDLSANALEAKMNLDEAKTATGNLGTTASLKSGDVSDFAGSVGNVGAQASAATTWVQSLANAINALHDKTVNIRVHTANIGGIETTGHFAESYAKGGFAGTGPLIFGPNGTDTIPSYLSPGEFVVNAKASKMFGPTFLHKVNGMDIGGAFDALMHNLARPSGLGYMPNVTFNRDNHASVNINNYGETGQGYSQRKAYAWASKL